MMQAANHRPMVTLPHFNPKKQVLVMVDVVVGVEVRNRCSETEIFLMWGGRKNNPYVCDTRNQYGVRFHYTNCCSFFPPDYIYFQGPISKPLPVNSYRDLVNGTESQRTVEQSPAVKCGG